MAGRRAPLGLFFACVVSLDMCESDWEHKVEWHGTGLVIAHPDDEVLFFTPSLTKTAEYPIWVLCLSNGNYRGEFPGRADELRASCLSLGIDPDRVHVINDAALEDGGNWDIMAVRNYVHEFAKQSKVAQIWTFDDYGVSGHPNHRAVSAAVRLWSLSEVASCPTRYLQSVSLARKYSGPAEYMLCRLMRWWRATPKEDEVVAFCAHRVFRGMRHHRSQLTWYRCFFVFLSRYSYINNWNW
eukprot:Polyplicarium_translucidae@DN2599_c0_g1_i1.p2